MYGGRGKLGQVSFYWLFIAKYVQRKTRDRLSYPTSQYKIRDDKCLQVIITVKIRDKTRHYFPHGSRYDSTGEKKNPDPAQTLHRNDEKNIYIF